MVSVWEFFDIIIQNEELYDPVYNLMHYDGQDDTIAGSLIEDKIYRYVLQWFWNLMHDSRKVLFEDEGCTPKDEEQHIHKNEVGNEIFNNDTKASRIIEIICYILGKQNNRHLKLYPLGEFLKIRNYMRNYSAHELNKFLKEEERRDAIDKILFNYVGIVLGLRIALESFLPPVIYPKPNHTCQLRVYYEKGENVIITNNKSGKEIAAIENCVGTWKEYILESTGDYKIEIAKNCLRKIPQRMLNCSYPVASVEKEQIKVYRSYREMDTRGRKTRDDGLTGGVKIIWKIITGIKKDVRYVLIVLIAILVVLVGLGILFYPDNQNESLSEENKKNTNAVISIGDSLLNIAWDKDYRLSEQVGQTYREAIGQLRRLAEQHNSGASIDLCHLYLSGKGCYSLDSAFYYVQKKEVRETKEGQGLYAYLLLKRGEMKLARKEFLRAIDPEEPYICLTKALYDMHNSINNQTTMHASKQTCENAYQSLSSINNDDAIFEKAIIDLWGIRNEEDEFLIHPNFGKAFNALYGLASRNPFAILTLGDIYNLMGDVGKGLTFHGAAFYCGVQEKAAIAINSSLILNPDGFSLTDKGKELMEIVAGKKNVIGGIGGILSDYVHYIDREAFDLAIKEADSLFYMSQQKTGDILFSDTSFISKIRITSRLMTGKSDDFSEAVRLAMQRDNCTDSIAVANYLKGVCLAKGYGCQKDISKSDALILSSAERGSYTEALYTQIKRRPPVFAPEKVTNWLEHYINPDLLMKSPKLACGVMEIALKYGRKYRESKNLGQLIVCLQYYLPKEMILMNDAISSVQDFDKMPINYNYEALERINDYICLAMGNGQSYMAQVGCSAYKVFCDKYRISQDIEAYESFRVKQRRMPDGIKANELDFDSEYALKLNPLPQYPDYAY